MVGERSHACGILDNTDMIMHYHSHGISYIVQPLGSGPVSSYPSWPFQYNQSLSASGVDYWPLIEDGMDGTPKESIRELASTA